MPLATKEEQREYQRKWIAKRRFEFFSNKYCARCGSKEQLHLHHKNKATKVTHRIWSWTKLRREIELKKCVVLCSKCHKRHHFNKGDFKLPPKETYAILNKELAQKIRQLKLTKLSNRKISKLFGVARQTIDDVVAGRTWK